MDSITTTPVPASDISMSRRLSSRFPSNKDSMYPDDIVNEFGTRNRSLNRNPSKVHRGSTTTKSMRRSETNTTEYEDEEESAEEGDGGEKPVRMSLMALLAESEGSSYMMGEEEEEEEDEEEDDGGGDNNLNNCCVCQVRHKGTAFVPCGHSFCRLCSRELWVEGGNCPLCNNFILEILDIF